MKGIFMTRRAHWLLAVVAGLLAAVAAWLFGPLPRAVLMGEKVVPDGFSPDSRWLIAEEWDRANDRKGYLVVDAATGEERLRFPARRVYSWAFGPDGRHLARAVEINDAENGIDVWDLETATEVKPLRWDPMPPNLSANLSAAMLTYTADGKLLLGSPSQGVWDVEVRKRIRDLPDLVAMGPMPARNRAFTDLVGYHEERARVRLVSVKTGAVVSEFPLPASLRNYHWSPDGRYLAADFYERTQIHVIDARTGAFTELTDGDGCTIESVAETVPRIAVSGNVAFRSGFWRWLPWWNRRDDVIRVIDFEQARILDEFVGTGAALSPDGATLAVRTRGDTVQIWDVPHGTPLRRCAGAALAAIGLVLLVQWLWIRRPKNRPKSSPALNFRESKPAPPASNPLD
jgi:WD40 repeat protein